MFIDGRWVGALGGATFDVLDPATGEIVARDASIDTTASIARAS